MTGNSETRCLGEQGFTLVEALVAIVILSIGLLSIAALQGKSLQYSHNSYQRSIAINQANDAVERLWAGVCVLDNPVTLDEIEDDWQSVHQNTAGMPNWSGTIVRSNESPPRYTITIEWQDARLDTDPTEFVYTTIIPVLPCDNT